jgi:hypothetical protein
MSTTQHYVQRAYLEGFIDPASVKKGRDSYLWVVDLKEKTVKPRAPKNIAAHSGYYDIRDGRYEGPSLEQFYAKIESRTIPVIKKLRAEKLEITINERHDLATYIGLQFSRVPRFREAAWNATQKRFDTTLRQLASDQRKLRQSLKRYFALNPKAAATFTPESVKTAILEKRIKIAPSRNSQDHFAALGLWAGFEVAPLVFSMKWTLVHNETATKFFTSDNPVALLTPDAKPPSTRREWNATVEIAFPLSPSRLLSIHSRLKSLSDVTLTDPGIIEYINRCLLPTPDRYVFCSSSEQAHWILWRRGE